MPNLRTAKSNVLVIFLVAMMLLMWGNAANAQQGHLIPDRAAQQYPIRLEVLNSVPNKVDLDPYLHLVYVSIERNLLAKLPESILNGEKGVVGIRVHIEKDGSLRQGAVRIVSSSGKKDMDRAAQSAIRAAAPFGTYPEGYVGSLDLLFTFGFAPQEPAQKSRIVPVGTVITQNRESTSAGYRD